MADIDIKALLPLVKDMFSGDGEVLRRLVEVVLNTLLQAEMAEHLKAEPHERTPDRLGYRNGYLTRTLTCRIGEMELNVPQARDGSFSTEMFQRFQRHERALQLVLVEAYVKGVSTRKVGDIAETLFGKPVSATTVSNLSKRLDHELKAWRSRSFDEEIPYLIVDARYEKVRVDGRVVSMGVLIVTGVTMGGYRTVLDFSVDRGESERTWSELFESLKARGLKGVQLVVSDQHAGLVKAIRETFPGASWQRCQFHFIRNILDMVPKRLQEEVKQGVRDIFGAQDLMTARSRAKVLVDRYERQRPKLAAKIDEEIEDTLAVLHFPASHRRRLRTTNSLERLNQEIKRRTRVVRIFPSPESVQRLVGTLLIEQDEAWAMADRRYLDMALLRSLRNQLDEDQQSCAA